MKAATCACGRKGKSKHPEHYHCGACYYGARAKSNEEKAKTLRARAKRLEDEVAVFRASAKRYADAHPILEPE